MMAQNNSMPWILGIGGALAWWSYENGYLASIFGTPVSTAVAPTSASSTIAPAPVAAPQTNAGAPIASMTPGTGVISAQPALGIGYRAIHQRGYRNLSIGAITGGL